MANLSDNEVKNIFANNLKRIMSSRGLDGASLARIVGAEKQSIYSWLRADSFPSANNLQRLVDTLNVSVDELLSNRQILQSDDGFIDIPLLGSISAGTPLEMLPIDESFPCPVKHVEKYGKENLYYLRIKGNSVNRIFPNGCLALIAKNIVEGTDRDLFAVCVNGFDATLKHVEKLENGIRLVPDSYDPTIHPIIFDYTLPDTEEVTVMGKVVWATMPFDWGDR